MFAPFDIITGSSSGGVSNREMASDIIATAAQFTDSREHWEELARTNDEDIDLDAWSDWLGEVLDDSLPPYTALAWNDNELTVQPCVESALEDNPRADELPDGIPSHGQMFCVVSDHGNVTLYQANEQREWREVWGVV